MMERAEMSIVNSAITFCNKSEDFLKTTATIQHFQTHYYTLAEQIFIYVVGALLSIITVSGNMLVCVAYYSNRRLQTITNFLICSLAITDITIGVFSVNIYTTYIVGKRWQLGSVVCNIWLCLDYSLCQVSVAHLVIICLDRYFSIKRPMKYRSKRTKHRAKIAVLLAWIISFLQWVPWIVSYPFIKGKRTVDDKHCYVQFLYEDPFTTIITATASYFLPVVVMGAVYVHIYLIISRKENIFKSIRVNFQKRRITEKGSVKYSSNLKTDMATTSEINIVKHYEYSNSQVVKNSSNKITDVKKDKIVSFWKLTLLLKQKKLTKTLVLTFFVFCFSWIPYFIVSVMAPFCRKCISAYAWNLCYMMGYINSMINPMCYALGSKDFKKTFKKLLKCKGQRVDTD